MERIIREQEHGEDSCSDEEKAPTAATILPNPLSSPLPSSPTPQSIRRHVLTSDRPAGSHTPPSAESPTPERSPTPRGHLRSRGIVHDHELTTLERNDPFRSSSPLAHPPPSYRLPPTTPQPEVPAAPPTPGEVRQQRRQEALLERRRVVLGSPRVTGERVGLGLTSPAQPSSLRGQFTVLPASEQGRSVFDDDATPTRSSFPRRLPSPPNPKSPSPSPRGLPSPHSLPIAPFRDSRPQLPVVVDWFRAQLTAETDVGSGQASTERTSFESTHHSQHFASALRARASSRTDFGGGEAGTVLGSSPGYADTEYTRRNYPPRTRASSSTSSDGGNKPNQESRSVFNPSISQSLSSISPTQQGFHHPITQFPETLYFTPTTPNRSNLANSPASFVNFRISQEPPPLPARSPPWLPGRTKGRSYRDIEVTSSHVDSQVRSNMATPSSSSQAQAPPMSPSSSPRLPSPPPFTEVQIGPKSPTIGDGPGDKDKMFGSVNINRPDDGAGRRIRPGTKAADMAFGPPLVPLHELDSPFQLQEHLKALYHHHTAQKSSMSLTPVSRDVAQQMAEPPEGVERSLWLYELCRLLVQKCNDILVAFFRENPPCSAQTCPEMRASEWQYLCAVHDPPKSCCAIDYCCHTLDWAGHTLASTKYFPSRLTLGTEAAGGSQASMRHLTNIFRRVYRIFAHAWFQHRSVFWQVEGKEGLYVFFKTVCDSYQLIPEDNYTIPAEAEGDNNYVDTPIEPRVAEQGRISILTHQNGEGGEDSSNVPIHLNTQAVEEGDATMVVSTGATTRRHKHTPSTGSFVTTIAETSEEEEGAGLVKEAEKEQNMPVEAKPKVDEKAGEVRSAAEDEEIAKGVSSLNLEEKQEKEAEGEVPEFSSGKSASDATEVQAIEAAASASAEDATQEPVVKGKAAEESGAEKGEVGGSGEI